MAVGKLKKWRYWTYLGEREPSEKDIDKINELGEVGWELVSVISEIGRSSVSYKCVYFFKRCAGTLILCKECGIFIDENAKFCNKCGAKLEV